jgi:RNA polymerase subunit RPABC4/transcription elongation factor Spt4
MTGLPRADGERVRFCMNCNEVVPFDVRVCPACGQFEPQPADERGAQRTCAACERPVSATLVLCPHSGRETGLVPLPREAGRDDAQAPDIEPAGSGVGRVAVALALAGPVLLLAAALATLA